MLFCNFFLFYLYWFSIFLDSTQFTIKSLQNTLNNTTLAATINPLVTCADDINISTKMQPLTCFTRGGSILVNISGGNYPLKYS
jgi:hypothetical protein